MTLLTGSLVYAGVLVSSQYKLSLSMLVNGRASTVSPNYNIQAGVLGQGVSGKAQSSSYHISDRFENRVAPTVSATAANLSAAYVYPNPFKPNSPGRFQADKITFKHLPAEVTIRIFAITGKQVAELHKTDETVDYEWNAVNSDGQKLASGVYIYFITAPDGDKTTGKFAIIR